MVELTFRPRLVLLMSFSVYVITYLTRTVSANAVDPVPFDRTVDLVLPNFPVNGFIILIVYISFLWHDGPPVHQGLFIPITLFLCATGIVTLSGALIDTVAFLQDELGVYLAAATLIMCIVFAVCYRYVRMSLRFSLVAGLVFLVWNLVAWLMIDRWFWVLVDNTVDFYALSLFFVGCVTYVAKFYHTRPPTQTSEDADGTPRTGGRGNFRIDRRFYLDVWLPLEAVLFCVVLMYMVLLISHDPIFIWNEDLLY